MSDDAPTTHSDFFISYTSTDGTWAQWIAAQLEDAGYSTILQAWDFRPGTNFVAQMNDATKSAQRTIVVLSPAYLDSDYAFSEWAVAFRRDPRGKQGLVLPVRVQQCDVEGLLGPIVYIDLVPVAHDEAQARETLLSGVRRERAKPAVVPFPRADLVHLEPLERAPFPGTLPPVWNVPYQRNTLFTGRDELLAQLATSLQAGEPTALSQPQAISGLGGIGKTQLALEYAYRYRQHYQTVLWAQADTREALTSSFTTLAELLSLPERNEQDVNRVIEAVKRWLRVQSDWLLVLDNADDLALAREFVPPALSGHLILTTRATAMGRFAHRLEVDTLPAEQGALFLLRRAGILAPDAPLEQASETDRTLALAICDELGGLPLALDQAGAYIDETGCSLADYQGIYQQRRTDLLRRPSAISPDYPHTVATTWSLSFERVEQANAAAADLLRLCAFLAPEAIPLELLSTGAAHLGPQLAPVAADAYLLNQAIEALRAYSLVRRDAGSKTLSVHRLVQVVLKDAMSKETYQQWAERAVRAVHAAFPEVTEFATWGQCERCVPHAQACAVLIEQEHMTFPEAARLLNQTGYYLNERALYAEAEPLHQRALAIWEQQLGSEHPHTATSLNNLASLYRAQGKYAQAEPLLQRALSIRKQQLGPRHPETAQSLNNLALLYQAQGKYSKAEPLYQRALSIREQQLGSEHPHTARSLNNLASLYHEQGKYAQAEPLLQRALSIREQQLGSEHPHTATSLNSLALLYHEQGKYAQAEPLYQRALAIYEQQLGPQHPETARSLNNLAGLYQAQGKYSKAEPLYQRALAIHEQCYGPEHPEVATNLNNLAVLYRAQGKYAQAEPLYQRALAIYEQQLGPRHPETATSLSNLARLYHEQGKYAQAEPLLKRALSIREQQLGPQHPDTAMSLNNLAGLYRAQGNYEQAEPLYQRALAIYEQQLGPQHPHTARSLNNLAGLYYAQGKYEQAEPLLKRALSICEQQLGPKHPDTINVRNGYNILIQTMQQRSSSSDTSPP